jgi:TetR/AcrR family transcriptional regulator, transcriptional repressor for nem operon
VEAPVPRYDKEHKEATRQRIIETAGRRFKTDGFDGSGVATLMADAGLTNGAFYAHFESKDDLVATVVGEQLTRQAETMKALAPGRDGLAQFIREYLTAKHRDNPGLGCPSAALLDEIGRSGDETKQAYTTGTKAIVEEIVLRLGPGDRKASRRTALALFSLLVGTMQLSRAISDRKFSDQVLAQGRLTALDLLAD